MSVLVDPVAVAEKVLKHPRGWSKTSVFEIKAMAGYILYREEGPDPEQAQPVFVADGLHMIPMRPAELDAERVPQLIAEIDRTFDALESARFSARESAARAAHKRALKALSDHYAMEPKHAKR